MNTKPSSKTLIRFYALQRLFLWACTSKLNNSVLVTEFPKSGGTWIASMIACYLDLPFPRNTSRPVFSRSVMLGHLKYSSAFNKPLVVVRDVRDIYISFYYHHLFPNDWNHHASVFQHRKYLNFNDFGDITSNLPTFIEYVHEQWGRKVGHFNWSEFIDHWLCYRSSDQFIRYENMLANPQKEMVKALSELDVLEIDEGRLRSAIDSFTFVNVTGRQPGEVSAGSFARKGVAGDWVNILNIEALKLIDYYCTNQLIALGYEHDRDWVKKYTQSCSIDGQKIKI